MRCAFLRLRPVEWGWGTQSYLSGSLAWWEERRGRKGEGREGEKERKRKREENICLIMLARSQNKEDDRSHMVERDIIVQGPIDPEDTAFP